MILDVHHVLDPLAEEILLARYAREEREFTEAAAVPQQPVELYIPSGELMRSDLVRERKLNWQQ